MPDIYSGDNIYTVKNSKQIKKFGENLVKQKNKIGKQQLKMFMQQDLIGLYKNISAKKIEKAENNIDISKNKIKEEAKKYNKLYDTKEGKQYNTLLGAWTRDKDNKELNKVLFKNNAIKNRFDNDSQLLGKVNIKSCINAKRNSSTIEKHSVFSNVDNRVSELQRSDSRNSAWSNTQSAESNNSHSAFGMEKLSRRNTPIMDEHALGQRASIPRLSRSKKGSLNISNDRTPSSGRSSSNDSIPMTGVYSKRDVEGNSPVFRNPSINSINGQKDYEVAQALASPQQKKVINELQHQLLAKQQKQSAPTRPHNLRNNKSTNEQQEYDNTQNRN